MEPQLDLRSRPGPARRAGIALVLVLIILSLITAMVVSLLVVVASEKVSAQSQTTSASARRLSDVAVQMVMSQIRDATLDGNGSDAWASQPGMVRTYDNSGGGTVTGHGKLVHAFKLYSNSQMVATSYNPTNVNQNDWAPSNWPSLPALWTDLNASADGVYPIFDPSVAGSGSADSSSGTAPAVGSGSIAVDGCYIDSTAAPLNASGNTNTAAMPVQWLYVLQDGEVVAPDAGGTGTLTFTSATTPPGSTYTVNGTTYTNAIIGRIAFWTDDETCKLNINTAGEGAPWDTPTYTSSQDVSYSLYQPAAFEYEHIMGHPASVCLSPVFWKVFGLPSPAYSLWPLASNTANYTGTVLAGNWDPAPALDASLQAYYNTLFGTGTTTPPVVPRCVTADSGSKVGTYSTGLSITSNGLLGPSASVNVNRNRLYTSVDELAFPAPFSPASPSASYVRTANATYLTPATVAKLRFFLTTESQAPELNLFHQPRVSIWPVADPAKTNPFNSGLKSYSGLTFNINQRSPTDKLMALCATLNPAAAAANQYPYYFVRYDPTSSTNDFYASTKLSGASIPRNEALWAYLRNYMDKPFPGFGGVFSTRTDLTPGICDQIVTEIFDYIRSSINICDSSNPGSATTQPLPVGDGGSVFSGNESNWFSSSYALPPKFTTVTGTVTGAGNVQTYPVDDTGQVVPITIDGPHTAVGTQGLGRIPSLRSVTLMFVASYADQPPVLVDSYRRPVYLVSTSPNVYAPLISNANVQKNLEAAGVTTTQIASLNATPPGNASPPLTSLQAAVFFGVNVPSGLPNAAPPPLVNPLHPFVMASDRAFTSGTGFLYGNPYAGVGNLAQTASGYYPGNPGALGTTASPCVPVGTNTFTAVSSVASSTITLLVNGTYTDEYPTANITTASATSGTTTFNYITGGKTYPGLPFLPVIDVQNLTYDLPNANYGINAPTGYTAPAATAAGTTSASGKLGPHQTAMEVGILPHLGTCSTGTPPLGAAYEIDISNQGGFTPSIPVGTGTFTTWQALKELVRGQYSQSSTGYSTGYWESNLAASDSSGKDFGLYSTTYQIVGGLSSATGGTNGGTFAFGGTQGIQLPVGVSYAVPKNGASHTYSVPAPNLFPTWVAFPAATFPTPKLPQSDALGNGPNITTIAPTSSNTYPTNIMIPQAINTIARYSTITTGITAKNDMVDATWSGGLNAPNFFVIQPEGFFQGDSANGVNNPYDFNPCVTFRSVECAFGDTRVGCNPNLTQSTQKMTNVGTGTYNNVFLPQANYFNAQDPTTSTYYLRGGTSFRGVQAYSNGSPPGTVLRPDNDLILSLTQTGGKTTIGIYPTYFDHISSPSFPIGLDNIMKGHGMDAPDLATTFDVTGTTTSSTVTNGGDGGNFYNNVWSLHCDFDNNIRSIVPGINKADEGSVVVYNQYNYQNPYFSPSSMLPGVNLFCPNRQVPSAVCFGSLPSGIDPNNPSPNAAWKTLQFSPNPNRSATPGADRVSNPPNPPDYLLLDLFQMPVVKPYAISGTFYTAGKVNMNYQMAPFNYIVRNTALRGVLKGVALSAVQDIYAGGDMMHGGYPAIYNGATSANNGSQITGVDPNYDAWVASTGYLGFFYPIHLGETLKQFDYRYFDQNDLFHSPAEICSLWLYPATQPTSANRSNPSTALVTWDSASANIQGWWYSGTGSTRKFDTGDNMRERPYGDLLAKLTTQSNTYTVHYRVQFLKKSPQTGASTWVEPTGGAPGQGQDIILGEYRGSSLIERYLDSNASGGNVIPDVVPTSLAGTTSTTNLDKYYKFRVVANRHFAP